jgi:hypothetical protein
VVDGLEDSWTTLRRPADLLVVVRRLDRALFLVDSAVKQRRSGRWSSSATGPRTERAEGVRRADDI